MDARAGVTIAAGTVRACCRDTANLEVRESGRPDVTLRVCRVCGRRHLEVTADPGAVAWRPGGT